MFRTIFLGAMLVALPLEILDSLREYGNKFTAQFFLYGFVFGLVRESIFSTFVQHYFFEGIPVVIIEAMAIGVAVIATRHSGIPEIVKNKRTGILVPEKDPLAIAEAIKLMAKDGFLRKTCVDNGRRIICQEFNIKNIAKLEKKIFEEKI